MASAPGKNASVEEILASIRQAISNDDARRTLEHYRSDTRAPAGRRPVANVTDVYSAKRDAETIEPEAASEDADPADEEVSAVDQDLIEQAIEQALNGVRAEIDSRRSAPRVTRPAAAREVPPVESPVQSSRAVPRARAMAGRKEISSPGRALLSAQTETQVSGSFDDLAKAMMGGDARKLDEVVEGVLRPMLKVWLESNLPQMVERLVRDEIERVTRRK